MLVQAMYGNTKNQGLLMNTIALRDLVLQVFICLMKVSSPEMKVSLIELMVCACYSRNMVNIHSSKTLSFF